MRALRALVSSLRCSCIARSLMMASRRHASPWTPTVAGCCFGCCCCCCCYGLTDGSHQACRFFGRAVLQPENTVGGSAAAVKARRQTRRLVIFLGANVVLMLIELAVGFYANSLSLLGDAGHMFFDCAALVIGLAATYVAKWDGNARFTCVVLRCAVLYCVALRCATHCVLSLIHI